MRDYFVPDRKSKLNLTCYTNFLNNKLIVE